jgi:photosystem II stability/assembly factor-like uncharacterized protein
MASAPGGRLMVVNDTGDVYFSDNNGDVWGRSGYSMGNELKSLLFVNDTEVLAGFTMYGIEKSRNGGESFAPVPQGVPDYLGKVSIGVDTHNRIYASSGLTIWRTDSGDDIWHGLSIPKSELSPSPFAFGDNGWIMAGALQSEDDGASWNVNYGGIDFFASYPTDVAKTPTGQMVITTGNGLYFIVPGQKWAGPRMGGAGLLAIAAGPGGTLFTGGQSYMMARSTDAGLTWEEMHKGLSGNRTNDIAADRFGNVYAATAQGIYRSADTGKNWSRVRLGADSAASFIALVSNPRGPIVAATGIYPGKGDQSRIYSSNDGGLTWVEQSVGLEGSVTTLALDSTGRMYAGMVGGRIFRTEKTTTTLSVPVIAGRVNRGMTIAVSPNPARHSASIEFDLAAQAHVKLRMLDLLGREVAAAYDGELASGRQQLPLRLDNISAGFYMVQLDVDGVVSTSRVVIAP